MYKPHLFAQVSGQKLWVRLIHETIAFTGSKLACRGHKSELINLLMSLQIHNIRFRQVCSEHLRTHNQPFFYPSAFLEFLFFFPKSCLKVGGVAYT